MRQKCVIPYYMMRADIEGPFLHSKCFIASATHDEEGRCGAGGNPNQASSGQRRRWSTSIIDNESMALMQCPSVLFAPTVMGHFYAYNDILLPPNTTRRYDVVLPATPNQPSSGLRRACSTSTIEIESMALMQCPSVLSAPTLMQCPSVLSAPTWMGHFYTSKAILQSPHTTRRYITVATHD